MIKFKEIEKVFFSGQKKWTLGPVNIEIKKGEAVAILGRSGSGKSTLLHLAGTLIRPTKGNIFFEENDVGKFSDKKLREFRNKKIGFVFQEFFLFPEFTLLENTAMPLIVGGASRSEANKKAENALKEVRLENHLNHLPKQLSGGQKQRGAIARAIVTKPEVILADEPTGNLDPETGEKIINLLKNIQKKHQTTLVLVTHDEKVAKICSRIIKIDNGKII